MNLFVNIFTAVVTFFLSVVTASAEDVGHDEVVSFNTNLGTDVANNIPIFAFGAGCLPYTAVEADGDTSGGLSPTGDADSGCSDDTQGTLYARSQLIDNTDQRFLDAPDSLHQVVMYALYFPKDQGESYSLIDGAAVHRHDWEEIVIFLDEAGNPIKAAASSHGDYESIYSDEGQYFNSGNRLMVVYSQYPTISTTNAFHFAEEDEFLDYYTLDPIANQVDWDLMSEDAQEGLENKSWGSASPKFTDGNFEAKIEEAWNS